MSEKNFKNRLWVLAERPDGMVGEHYFIWQEVEGKSPNDGELLLKNLYLSFDPAH